jgi:MFS family permease
VWWETRQKQPVLNISFFRNNTVFAFSNLAALINYSATFAVAFLLSLYLQYVKGFSPEHAGLILIAQPVIMVICSPIAGSLSDRIEPRIVASIGMALTTAGLVMLTFLSNVTSLQYVLISLVILGLGFGFFSSPNTNAVMGSVERKFYGVASGTLGTMRLTGQAFSMGMVLLLFALYIGRVQITPEYYPLFLKSMKIAFSISAALCFAGIFASIARGRTHQ